MTAALSDPKSIFLEALDCDAPGALDRFLAAACGDDRELRARVDALLAAHDEAGRFLGGASLLDETRLHQSAPPLGSSIGPYKLREVLGEGGMGIVFAAEQEQPIRRKVALKVVRPGMDSEEVIARFEAERQALALMDHRNIARVLDAGMTTAGRPYFVMELVRGLPITEYCDRAQLGLRERLELFIDVCEAIQHAHLKGIIHRDLKPSNVMITLHDGVPVPKVIDFGVAKALNERLTDRTIYTRVAQMLGTPMYMSPEQAELSGLDVDTRSDVYSLGVLLYELLTGHTPFDREKFSQLGYDEVRRIIREVDPAPPSARVSTLNGERQSTLAVQRGVDARQLMQSLQGELDWIVIQSLEKDRNRRYQSPSALASDVRRYLADEPVAACPPSFSYRLTKAIRRHTAALTTAAVVLLTLVAATVVSVKMAVEATKARQIADELLGAEQRAVQQMQRALGAKSEALERYWAASQRVYPTDIQSAFEVLQNGRGTLASEVLQFHVPDAGAPDRRGFEWWYLSGLAHPGGTFLSGHAETVFSVSFSPDGRRLASSSGDLIARVWDTATGELVCEMAGHTDDVNCVEFSREGDLLATASDDLTIGIWDSSTGERLQTLQGHTAMVHCARFSPDGRLIASGSTDGEVKTWDWQRERVVGSVAGHEDRVRAVAFMPDGERLVTGSGGGDPVAKLWRLPSLAPVRTLPVTEDVEAIAIRPHTEEIVTGSRTGVIRFWDDQTGELLRELKTGMYVLGLAFSPDGGVLATATGGGNRHEPLVLWDADALIRTATYSEAEPGDSWCVSFSPNGDCIAAGANDDVVLLRQADRPNEEWIAGLECGIGCLRLSPEGLTSAIGCQDGTLRRIDLTSGEELSRDRLHRGGIQCLAVSPDSRLLATGGADRIVNVWDASARRAVRTLSGFSAGVSDVAFSMDGGRIAACDGHAVTIWETATWQVVNEHSDPSSADCLGFSGMGGLLMAGNQIHYLTPQGDVTRIGAASPVRTIDVSDDGRLAALGYHALNPCLFDFFSLQGTAGGGVTDLSALRSNGITAVALTHDGRTLAAVDSRGWTGFWNVTTGAKMLTISMAELTGFPEHFDHVSIEFAADDSRLVFGLTPAEHENGTPYQAAVFALNAPRPADVGADVIAAQNGSAVVRDREFGTRSSGGNESND